MLDTLEQIWAQWTAPGGAFEIQVEEIRGTPQRVYAKALPDLRALWDLAALKGDRDFLVYEDERFSFAEVDRQVRSVAASLVSLGLQPGDRVALAMRNYPEWVIVYWATVSIGAVAVGLNAWWTGPELEYGLIDSASVVLVADGERLAALAPTSPPLPPSDRSPSLPCEASPRGQG